MDKKKRCRHAKPVIVQLKYLHGNDPCETSAQYNGNFPLDRQFLSNVRNYVGNGNLLLDIDENDLQNITIRVAEQMVSVGVIKKFDINNVSNVLMLTEASILKGEDEEEHKPDDIHHKSTEIIDIPPTCNNGNYTKNLQREFKEFNQQLEDSGVVVMANADFILKPSVSFVRLRNPVHFPQSLNFELPVRFVFVLLVPTTQSNPLYLDVGNSLWTVLFDDEFRLGAYSIKTKDDLITGIENVLANDPSNYEDEEYSNLLRTNNVDEKVATFNPLLRTNRLWGGLINDITRRLPHYRSDICDGLNRQVIAAALFLYFGVLSTAITFGGLMSSKTSNLMGISETLLATSLVGIVFHLISAQPLMIVGGTGPLLLFDEALFQLCQLYKIDFLTIRIYIGIWLGLIAVAIAAFDGCVYLRLLTRFTQELFASLISLIFIMEAVFKVIDVFKSHPISTETNNTKTLSVLGFNESESVVNRTIDLHEEEAHEPNTALFCAILTIGTFVLAYCLRVFRNSHFLGRGVRRAIGDFGVPIAITFFVYLSYLVPQIYTEKLIVPEGISPTSPNARSWVIPFNEVPIWAPFISVLAAMLVYVLIFMETQISELILDSRGLKKGCGFHVDIVIICLVNVVFGFLGMPWQSGATIRSVTHVSAVTTIATRSKESGGSNQIIVKEQRVSGLIISICVGLSVFMAPFLRNIPVSILYGVFFYMGIVSISGVQFLDRIRLIFTPTKYHGTEPYVQRVPTWKMHIFTCVQALALCSLWMVKSSRFSLALPFVLILMIPLKQKLATYYTATEMAALDGNLPEVDVKDEPDFYEQSHLPA